MGSTKKTKRNQVKYPGLDPSVNAKPRWEFIDHDYIDKLSPKEKEWLSNFNEEYLSGNFQHKGKKLHKTKEEKRACYTRNNARNRDVYAISKATQRLDSLDSDYMESKEEETTLSPEDNLIELLDFNNESQKTKLVKGKNDGTSGGDNET